MKKFLCLLLAVCLVFSFAACTASDQPQDPDTDNPAAGDNAAGSENAGNTAGADTGKEDQDADPSGEDSAQKPDDHQKDDITKEDEASKPEQKPSASTDKPAASKPSASKPSTSKPSADKHDTDKANKPSSPLNLLNTVWKSYSEDDKFPASGGDYSEENAKDDAPGKFDVSDSAVLESTLAVPEDSADLLEKAASLTHMMNLNTFTAGAFQLKDSKNADKFAKAMKESIENRRWVCGFSGQICYHQGKRLCGFGLRSGRFDRYLQEQDPKGLSGCESLL